MCCSKVFENVDSIDTKFVCNSLSESNTIAVGYKIKILVGSFEQNISHHTTDSINFNIQFRSAFTDGLENLRAYVRLEIQNKKAAAKVAYLSANKEPEGFRIELKHIQAV